MRRAPRVRLRRGALARKRRAAMTSLGAASGRRVHLRALPPGRDPSLLWLPVLAAGAIAALALAKNAGVAGPSAAPDVIRAGAAGVFFFGICGYAPARLLTPAPLARDWQLLVLPLGAVCGSLALTLLGFLFIPFFVTLPLVVIAAVAAAVLAHRHVGAPPAPTEPGARPASPLAALAVVALLIAALALIPVFRSGVATVTGIGSDAHVVAGAATVLQHTTPGGNDASLPVDQIPWQWRSKFPIYYALAAVSSISGLAPWQALMTTIAVLFAITALGFYLLARHAFRATAAVATAAAVVAVLDQMVFHLALHPYYNQLWGTFTLPFAIVAAQIWVADRNRITSTFLALFLLVGILAYPLMAPFPVGAAFFIWLIDRVQRRRRGEQVAPLRPPRWTRHWWVTVPLLVLCSAMIVGVVEKFVEFIRLIGDTEALTSWQGDLFYYPPLNQFFGVARQLPLGVALVAAVVVLAAVGLWRAGRVGWALIPVLGAAGAMAVWFRYLDHGQYVYFKILAFTGPLALVAAVVALGRMRALGGLGIAALLCSCVLLARDEIRSNYDQLTPETIQLEDWARSLPKDASIRLDIPDTEQIWPMYMLHDRPTGSRTPLIYYPHVQFTDSADYALDHTLAPPPADRAGAQPVLRNGTYRLWRLRAGSGRDTTSRAQSNAAAPAGSLADPG
jgi:hypothetical protein